MARWTLLFAMTMSVVALARPAHASSVFCCELTGRTCAWSSYVGVVNEDALRSACPVPGDGQMMLAVTAVDQQGALAIRTAITSPPFHGICTVSHDKAQGRYYYPPDSCIPLAATGGFRSELGYHNAFLRIGQDLGGANVGFTTCYEGADELVDDSVPFWDGTNQTMRLGASPDYSCTELGWLSPYTGSKSGGEQFLDHIPDIPVPDVVGVPAGTRVSGLGLTLLLGLAGARIVRGRSR